MNREWNTINWKAIERFVFKLQRRIYQASKENRKFEMFRLQRILISSDSAKLKAVRKVTQDNQGKRTAGVDNITVVTPSQRCKLASDVKIDGQASPIRRIYIPKGKGDEMRPLGIPTIADRAKQALALMGLEPEWEAKFEANSYGFQPGRSCQDAIEAIFIAIGQKPKFVLDADIQGCFNELDHSPLLGKLETFPEMEKQIKSWLKAGILEDDMVKETLKGTPQGSVISPLLMNIALHGMENAVTKYILSIEKGKPSSINIVRYADDFVILHKSSAAIEECRNFVEVYLKRIGLNLKESKTRICHTLEPYKGERAGFDFLGFNIRQYPIGQYTIRKSKAALPFRTLIRPSKEKIKVHWRELQSVLRKIKDETVLIMELNPKIVGWSRYYRSAVSFKTFKLMDTYLFRALLRWQYRKHPTRSRKWLNARYFHQVGDRKWVFGHRMANGDLVTLKQHSDTKIERFVKVRGNKSHYDGDIIYWGSRLNEYPLVSGNVSQLLKKQKGRCKWCNLPFFPTDIIERDHIVPVSQCGKHNISNFQLLHNYCHKKKSRLDLDKTRGAG